MTKSNVVQALPGGIVSRDQQESFFDMDRAICLAIDEAKRAGVPQGFIVAALHGHAATQTLIMTNPGD